MEIPNNVPMYTKTLKTQLQEIRLEYTKDETLLYLDGYLQFSSIENHLYDSALTTPAIQIYGTQRSLMVLILGGGDGLLASKLLESCAIESIHLCEIDSEMIDFCRTEGSIVLLNKKSLENPKVDIIINDAFEQVKGIPKNTYDLIIADFPDPYFPIFSKLYSKEFYLSIQGILKQDGIFTTIACEINHTANCYRCIGNTLGSVFQNIWSHSVEMPKSYGKIGLYTASNKDYKLDARIYKKQQFEPNKEINTVQNMVAHKYFMEDTQTSQFIPGITNR